MSGLNFSETEKEWEETANELEDLAMGTSRNRINISDNDNVKAIFKTLSKK